MNRFHYNSAIVHSFADQPPIESYSFICSENASMDTSPNVVTNELTPDASEAETGVIKFTLRPAEPGDIVDIVDVDLKTFDTVYKGQNNSDDLREELIQKFALRLSSIGGEWMPVLERNGKIVGAMTSCPTNKTPDDFESWEKTTDNGTLTSTYDPKGKNVYVVSLSVLPEGTQGKNMLFANQIGKMLREGYELGFFESRLPGLREWVVKTKCNGNEDDANALAEDIKTGYAEEYFNLPAEVNGKKVRHDKLIRLYEKVGCKCLKLVPGAYADRPSMDYGVVCVYDGNSLFDGSDLPIRLPQNRATRWIFGAIMQRISRSPKLTAKLFK